jgi:Ca2+-binding RTX toxin-like protein
VVVVLASQLAHQPILTIKVPKIGRCIMATLSGGQTIPINFNTLQVDEFDYDFSRTSSSSAKYFDNPRNYTLFQGSDLTFDTSSVPTGGTFTSVKTVLDARVALAITGFEISATTFYDLASQNNTQGLLSLVLNGDDTLNGTPLADVLSGFAGDDILKGAGGKDLLDGGTGRDTALYTDKAGPVVVALKGSANATVTVGGLVEDTIRNIENVTGGRGADTLTGNGIANVLNGGAGNDIIRGGGGADTLIGGRGSDFLNGNSGKDTIDYSNDAASGGTSGVIVNLLGNGSQGGLLADTAKDGFGNIDIVKNIPNVVGTGFADKIFGGNHSNTLSGGAGDYLLAGGAGNDTIYGGTGADDLFGGSGADVFQFKTLTDSKVAVGGRDTIFDFSRVAGDKIDLSAIDADGATPGDEAFTFIGATGFTGTAGELRIVKGVSNTYVYGDTTGDGLADFAIHLDDAVTLSSAYFVL